MAGPADGGASWSEDELARIAAAEELRIAPRRRDGSLRKAVPIWVVRVGDDLYVRAAYGPRTGWHRVARTSRVARVSAGGVEREVRLEDADPGVADRLDEAYRTKYRRYAASIVDTVTNADARASTLRLVPRPAA